MAGIALAFAVSSAQAQAPIAERLGEALRLAPSQSSAGRLGAGLSDLSDGLVRFRDSGHVHVYIGHEAGSGVSLVQLATSLRSGGAIETIPCPELDLVEAWVPLDQINAIAAIDAAAYIGLPAYGRVRTGSVNSAGDSILRADAARSDLGVTGAGARVGVISDGVDSRAAAQATGDLPPTIWVGTLGEDDEGTAMLEIIHDLAPGAELGFSSGLTTAQFIDSISRLANEFGADIIVDDIGFFTEPFYEDGPVALAAQAFVDAGGHFFSAAGNESRQHYEAVFTDAPGTAPGLSGGAHDFGGGDVFMELPRGRSSIFREIILQWSDPFTTPFARLRLHLYTASGSAPVASSRNLRSLTGSLTDVAGVFIDRPSGVGFAEPLFLVVERGVLTPFAFEIFLLPEDHEYMMRENSVFGHPAARGVLAVGAINAADPGADDPEPFSQVGPAEIFQPSYEIREKPDFAAIDGVAVTGAGGFPSPFFGTSASAPHAAAIAALMFEANPDLTPEQMKERLQKGAVDIQAEGFDSFSGAGRLDAAASVALALHRNRAGSAWTLYE